MMNARQTSSEAVAIPKQTRYNMEGDGRMADSPPSAAVLGNPPTFFKIPSKYYSLVGHSAVPDIGINNVTDESDAGPTGSSARSIGMRRVASEAFFRGGALPSKEPFGRQSHVVAGVDITPHYDMYASMLSGGGGSSGILSGFSKQSSALTQPATAAGAAAANVAAVPHSPATVAPAAPLSQMPAAAGSQPSSLLTRGSSLLNFFSPSKPATPAVAAPPLPLQSSEVAKSASATSIATPAPSGVGNGKLFARVSAPELMSGFTKPGNSSRRKAGGLNAKDLNALTPMDM